MGSSPCGEEGVSACALDRHSGFGGLWKTVCGSAAYRQGRYRYQDIISGSLSLQVCNW